MQFKRFRIPAVFVVLFYLGFVASAEEAKPKVAVKTFANPANFSRSTIGDGLTDMLTTELENTGKFNVLERSQIDELTKEIDFGSSGYGSKQTFAQKGNLLGAQYLLMGKVTNFSYAETGQQKYKVNLMGPNTYVTEYQKQADVRVDFRLVDVATGETVISQQGTGHAADRSEVSEIAMWQGIITSGAFTAESSSSLIGRATTDAIHDIVRKLNSLSEVVQKRSASSALSASVESLVRAKGTVVAEEGGGLWIVGGIGNANGLRVGDRLRLLHENVVKDKTGKVVYQKSVEIGSMEVTDVSQPDRSEVRFLPTGGTGPAVSPQANDAVTVDVDYARKVRGGSGSSTIVADNTGAGENAAGGSSVELDESIKRADSYVSDRFWSQALDEYKHAAAINANDQRILEGEALSHYMLGDFIEGDELADKLLRSGGTFSFPIAHFHGMGTCTGEMKIQLGKLAYSSQKGDGFDVGPQGVAGAEVKMISKGMMANEKLPDWPMLNIRWRDGGKEKDYQMLPYGYSKNPSLGGKNIGSAFPMGDSDVRDMQKFEQSIAVLIQKYAR
jgi:curli biogenesis system outer membrane secretion channel CsgG